MENVRLNLSVPSDIPDKMSHLAKGERRRGAWLADLVNAQYAQGDILASNDITTLHYQMIGLMAKVNGLENQLKELQSNQA